MNEALIGKKVKITCGSGNDLLMITDQGEVIGLTEEFITIKTKKDIVKHFNIRYVVLVEELVK